MLLTGQSEAACIDIVYKCGLSSAVLAELVPQFLSLVHSRLGLIEVLHGLDTEQIVGRKP